MSPLSVIYILVAMVASPLLSGLINRVKANFAGREGQPVMQVWFDIAKLLRKGSVYSRTTTLVFRLGPLVGLATVLLALTVVPMAGQPALVAFPGDLLLMAYLLGLGRFATVLAALDTGSAFEGMGASREVQFSALVEPALFLGLVAVARLTGAWSLTDMTASMGLLPTSQAGVPLALVSATLLIVLLTENARIPVDDPNTHLELTMIHEVMVLDNSGPELGIIHYASSLKLWLTSALLVNLVLPVRVESDAWQALLWGSSVVAVILLVGVVESTMARLRLLHVPRLLVGASALSLTALFVS